MPERWRAYIPLYLRLFRSFCLYPSFLLIWALSMVCATAFRTEETFLLIAAAIAMPFILFSVLRVFSEQDTAANARFAASEAEGFFARARVVVTSRAFLIDLAFLVGLLLLLPFEAGFYHLSLGFAFAETRTLKKLLVLAIGLPLVTLLLLWARLSAWQNHLDRERTLPAEERTAPDMMMATVAHAQYHAHGASTLSDVNEPTGTIDAAGRAYLRRGSTAKPLLLHLGALLILYCIGGLGLFLFTPILVSVWNILLAIGALRWWLPLALLGGAILVFWLVFLLRAVRIRRRFLKNLRKLCRDYGFRTERVRRAYRSLFFHREGANLRIHAGGKCYDVKFFGAIRRHWELFFDEHGTVRCTHALRFRRVEFLRFTTEYDFSFESDAVKICLVAPVPKVIYAGNDKWHRPIDTGMAVGEYRIFSSNGFLNALRRDCVERD